MKKLLNYFLIALSAVLVVGCNGGSSNNKKAAAPAVKQDEEDASEKKTVPPAADFFADFLSDLTTLEKEFKFVTTARISGPLPGSLVRATTNAEVTAAATPAGVLIPKPHNDHNIFNAKDGEFTGEIPASKAILFIVSKADQTKLTSLKFDGLFYSKYTADGAFLITASADSTAGGTLTSAQLGTSGIALSTNLAKKQVVLSLPGDVGIGSSAAAVTYAGALSTSAANTMDASDHPESSLDAANAGYRRFTFTITSYDKTTRKGTADVNVGVSSNAISGIGTDADIKASVVMSVDISIALN